MTDIAFLNESGVAVPAAVRAIIVRGLAYLNDRLAIDDKIRATFDATRSKVIFVRGTNPRDVEVDVTTADGLRDCVFNFRTGVNRLSLDWDKQWSRRPVPESTLAKCEEPQPEGVMRVLFITPEMTGTCKIGLAEALGRDGIAAKEHQEMLAAGTIKDVVLKALSGLDDKSKRQVLRSVQELIEHEGYNVLVRQGHDLAPMFFDFIKRVELAPTPPSLNTAANVEAMAMAASYAFSAVPLIFQAEVMTPEKIRVGQLVAYVLQDFCAGLKDVYPALVSFMMKAEEVFGRSDLQQGTERFFLMWIASNFARLEISHKLAASLCLTDVPDGIEVQAPWDAWSLVVPDGLLTTVFSGNIARIWCVGTSMKFLVLADGSIHGPFAEHIPPPAGSRPEALALRAAVKNLVQGACLALADPEEYKKDRLKKGGSSSSKSKRSGPPELEQARYMLSAPITLDLREPLREYLSGSARKGSKLTSQFLVRGHWRQQVHGTGRLLRKKLWIKPFWKGDENARILLRNYKVKEDGEAEENSGDKKSGSADTS